MIKFLGTKTRYYVGCRGAGYRLCALVAWFGHDAGIVYMGVRRASAVGNGLFKQIRLPLLFTSVTRRMIRVSICIYDVLYVRQHRPSSMLATPWLAARYGWSTRLR
ncbi:hypothetical protein KCP70_23715 [Salmonella enterica subsp. enterica]|nr:hypothetical protein KCP70_23715 [Salmonella enterica subsp. enterica]